MNTPALLRFKTEDHSELFLYTIFPSMIVYKIFVSTANGLPFTSTKSASFPSSMLPTRSWTSICFAALIVTACNAVNSSSPLAIAFPAQSGRYCSSLTGESVIIQTEHPASAIWLHIQKKVRPQANTLLSQVRPRSDFHLSHDPALNSDQIPLQYGLP